MAMGRGSIETLNLPEINMSNFVKIVSMAMRSRMDCADKDGNINSPEALENLKKSAWNRPILALGKPGIGKTEIMRGTISRKLGVGIKEVRLGSMQDSDITGLPTFEEQKLPDGTVKKFTTFANLRALPHTKEMGGTDPEFGILVLDEITTCNEQVRTVALQLLDSSRSIGESYHVPNGWMIVALGNGPDDGADYAGMPETVISRMSGFYVHPDIEAWYEWASQSGIHDVVLGYLKQNKEYLYNTTYESEGGYGVQITNPRTWEATSDALKVAEKYSPNHVIDDELIVPICSAGIGGLMGAKLATFYSFRKDVIPMDEILDGTAKKKHKPKDIRIEALYLSQQALIREYLNIGEKYAKQLKSTDSIKLTFSLKNSKFSEPTADTSGDALPDEAVKKLVNLTDFIMYCTDPAIPAGLDFAISTIESITKSSTYTNNPIPRYMAQPNTKFGQKCTEFSKFIKEHQKLLNVLHSAGNEAYV
jgi:hypothetical protein